MNKICQICSVIPPYKDAVGGAAIKLKVLLEKKDFVCGILTSSDQQNGTDIYSVINKWNLFKIFKSVQFLKLKKYNLIYFHYPSQYYRRKLFVTFIPLIFKMFGFNSITFLHEYYEYSLLGKIRILPLLIFSTKIITTDKVNLLSINKIPKIKNKTFSISIGSNFFDDFFTNSKIKTMDESNNKKKIELLYFGYIMEGKGIETIIELYENNNQFKELFSINFIGGIPEIKNSYYDKLLNKIKSVSDFKYYGFLKQERLLEVFNSIDIVLLPFDNGVTERRGSFMTCMGLGKTVITTQPKIEINGLEHMKNVIFIKNFDSKEILKLIANFKMLSKNKLNEIGQKAHHWYMENYSDEIFISKIIKVINSL